MTTLVTVTIRNKHNPMMEQKAVGYNTVEHAIAFCRIDLNHWDIIDTQTKEI